MTLLPFLLLSASAQDLFLAPGLSAWHPALERHEQIGDMVAELRNLHLHFANRSVAAGKALHRAALTHARSIERAAGHQQVIPPLPHLQSLGSTCGGNPGRMVDPIAFGADPTGQIDSSPAFARALAALLNKTAHGSHMMASNIFDLGGATLDLSGGEYLISAPLVVPPFFGNCHFRDGTLRAAPSFPADKHLIMVGDPACKPLLPSGKADGQGSCNEFVSFSDMLFDSSHVAAGGLYIAKTMGATIGPSAFFIGFKQQGIRVDAGHEVLISETWLASCYWSQGPCAEDKSIGIQINGNDHYLTNVIVFDFAKVGIEINGAANVLTSVHTWNGGGVGISLGTPQSSYGANQNRLIGCYLDYNTLDMYDPSQIVIENTFFLATHAILHALKGTVSGLVMRYNTYTTAQSVVLDGVFKSMAGVLISDEVNAAKTTRARRSMTQKAATHWKFDFSESLLFPNIDDVTYSVTSGSPSFFQHVARPPQGAVVVVETSVSVDATVVLEVSQAA